MPTTIRPTGVERSFGADEVIVTKTDLQGRITYANDVFCRVSAYPESEMLGSPHNVIRHPDMPRGVFRLLWQTLAERRELFAYVVNLAGDGAHYWVLAHVTPSVDCTGRVIGYHSNRRLPDPRAVRAVQPIYQQMIAEERRVANAAQAGVAGADLLQGRLEEQRTTYDQFVWALTNGTAA